MLQFTNPYNNPMWEVLIHFTDHKNEDRGGNLYKATTVLIPRILATNPGSPTLEPMV